MDITILVDTREKSNFHIMSRLNKMGIAWETKKLSFGDYSFIHDGISYENKCIIERKANLDELAGNLTINRKRFASEFERATSVGAKINLLIEDAKGRDILKIRRKEEQFLALGGHLAVQKTYRSKFRGLSYINTLGSWKERYGMEIVFCSKIKMVDEMMQIFKQAVADVTALNLKGDDENV